MGRSNFNRIINPTRMTDTEYIAYLEEQIIEMHINLNKFMEGMDEAVFHKDQLAPMKFYSDNMDLLRVIKNKP